MSSPELLSDLAVPNFKSWDSMPADEEPSAEYFSAEVWSDHLESSARDSVFELGDTSVQDSDVESN